MSVHSILISSDGRTLYEEWDDEIPLIKMQDRLGGYIQLIPEFDEFPSDPPTCFYGEVYCNEEGRLLNLPFNEKATKIYQRQLIDKFGSDGINEEYTYIYGPVLFVFED